MIFNLVPSIPTSFVITNEVFMEMNVLLTFDWDRQEDMNTMFTFNITVTLRPPLQSMSWVVDNPPWSLDLNLNSFMDVTFAITAVNDYCEISSDPSTLHYACT